MNEAIEESACLILSLNLSCNYLLKLLKIVIYYLSLLSYF